MQDVYLEKPPIDFLSPSDTGGGFLYSQRTRDTSNCGDILRSEHQGAVFVKKISIVVPSITIDGSHEFHEATNLALAILKDLPSFQEVRPYLAIIKEFPKSGMYTNTSKPTFEVGRPTWSICPIWYASAIVHDACHSKLCYLNRRRFLWFSYTPPRYWTGKEAEKVCLQLQLQALREITYDTTPYQREILLLIENPTYQDIPYYKRDW